MIFLFMESHKLFYTKRKQNLRLYFVAKMRKHPSEWVK